MACRFENCVKLRFYQKVFLGRDFAPPRACYMSLHGEDGQEPQGESYTRQLVKFEPEDPVTVKSTNEVRFSPRIVGEDWGRIAGVGIRFTKDIGERSCTCVTSPVGRPRLIQAGDTLLWEVGCMKSGTTMTSKYLTGLWTNFAFRGIDFAPPDQFYLGLLSARPNKSGYLEQAGVERKPVTFTFGKGARSIHNVERIEWTTPGGSSWDVVAVGVFDAKDALDEGSHLITHMNLPFGGKVAEPGDNIEVAPGAFSIG